MVQQLQTKQIPYYEFVELGLAVELARHRADLDDDLALEIHLVHDLSELRPRNTHHNFGGIGEQGPHGLNGGLDLKFLVCCDFHS